MKHIKAYRAFEGSGTIYDADWRALMPVRMTVLKDGEHEFRLGNIMRHSDMVQVTYENKDQEWGIPSTLEFDFYFSKENGRMRLDIDVTWGDAMACEFYVESPSDVGVTHYTSYGSKADPSNTVFALEDDSIAGLVKSINKINGFRITAAQLNFLDKRDDYLP